MEINLMVVVALLRRRKMRIETMLDRGHGEGRQKSVRSRSLGTNQWRCVCEGKRRGEIDQWQGVAGAGGTVIDSGTTLTFLPEPAYRQILAAMERRVRLPRVAVGGAGAGSTPAFDLRVDATSAAGGGAPPPPPLPRLGLRLAGGALFSPPSRNYFVDAAPGVRCLALQPVAAPAGFGVIGNLMQQGFLFVFDRDRSRLGFSRTGCSA